VDPKEKLTPSQGKGYEHKVTDSWWLILFPTQSIGDALTFQEKEHTHTHTFTLKLVLGVPSSGHHIKFVCSLKRKTS
jgi:hypothetical protein